MKEKEEKVEQQNVENKENQILKICKILDNALDELLKRKQYFVLLSMIVYVMYFVFYIGEYPSYNIEDVINFTISYIVWFLLIASLLYFPYEVAVLTMQLDIKKQAKITISGGYILICMTIVFIYINLFSSLLANEEDILYQLLWNFVLLVVYCVLLCLAYKTHDFNIMRIYFLIFLFIYLVFSNINIIGRAGIGNYYANIIVETASFDRVYLNEKSIKVQDINICEEGKKDKNTQEEKQSIAENAPKENTTKESKDIYCIDKNIIRFDNIKVLLSVGKKTFLEYKVNDKAIKLNFDSSKVKFIKKQNIPIEN